jgi:hypothetical protein
VTKPDRSKFARDNVNWLIPAFGAVLLLGIMGGSFYAIAAGVAGLGWIGLAVWAGK